MPDRKHVNDPARDKTLREFEPGTHILGEHVWVIIRTGRACQSHNTKPGQTGPLLEAIVQAMDLTGAGIPALRPRAASPDKPATSNRDRAHGRPDPDRIASVPLPMNPVMHHHASGASRPPSSQLDSGFWRSEHDRTNDHWDRCEVVRRAANHLANLITPDPDEVAAARDRAKVKSKFTRTQDQEILQDGHGHDLVEVARHFKVTIRVVAMVRITAKPRRHPLTGKVWAPPDHPLLAAEEARAMKTAGLTSTDIAAALDCNASTVRHWTSNRRRAA